MRTTTEKRRGDRRKNSKTDDDDGDVEQVNQDREVNVFCEGENMIDSEQHQVPGHGRRRAVGDMPGPGC